MVFQLVMGLVYSLIINYFCFKLLNHFVLKYLYSLIFLQIPSYMSPLGAFAGARHSAVLGTWAHGGLGFDLWGDQKNNHSIWIPAAAMSDFNYQGPSVGHVGPRITGNLFSGVAIRRYRRMSYANRNSGCVEPPTVGARWGAGGVSKGRLVMYLWGDQEAVAKSIF